MYVYQVINQANNRCLVCVSKDEPFSVLEAKYKLAEKEEGLPPFERDMLNFGLHKFAVIPVCEMNNETKAKKKANTLIDRQNSPYNQFYFEVFS